MGDAMKKHPEADVLISFASLRSAYESTVETMQYPQVRSERTQVKVKTCTHFINFTIFPNSCII